MPAGDPGRYVEPAEGDWILGLGAPLAVVADEGEGPRFTRISAGFLQAMGWTRAEAAGRTLEQLLPPDAWLVLSNAFHRAIEGRGPVEATAPIRRSHYKTSPTSFRLQSMPGGAVVEIISPAEHRDGAVGWRRVLFQHLNLMGSGAAAIYDRSPTVAADVATLLGYAEDASPAEADLIHPQDAPRLDAHRRRLAAADEGYIARVTTRMRHADGDWRWIEIREEVLNRTLDGAMGQVLGFAIDVSEHHALLEAAHRQSLAVMHAETEERRRIARELHDTMAQYLVVIDLALSRLERTAAAPLPDEPVGDIRQALKAAHEEVRSFSWLLHPPDIERLGLSRAIEKFGAGFGARTGLSVVTETGELPNLSSASELTLFRITQEALMNVHRHARATEVHILLKPSSAATVSLDVIDNGVGLAGANLDPTSGEGVGVGLSGMKARVERLSGTMAVMPGKTGFHLRVSLPVEGAPKAGPKAGPRARRRRRAAGDQDAPPSADGQ
ncbi:PAS domain-containing protein [Brevundimonas sp. Root1423]|uniref:sensor histidine kinase n=1 Tax=Brevundimonas sp. Root1423 TaxID=1736462 RepID=UPI001F2CC8D5|nr:PAS domain-containing protein [Brevundimonas sp. Root1423]